MTEEMVQAATLALARCQHIPFGEDSRTDYTLTSDAKATLKAGLEAQKEKPVWEMNADRVKALKHCRDFLGLFGVTDVIATDTELGIMLLEAERAGMK